MSSNIQRQCMPSILQCKNCMERPSRTIHGLMGLTHKPNPASTKTAPSTTERQRHNEGNQQRHTNALKGIPNQVPPPVSFQFTKTHADQGNQQQAIPDVARSHRKGCTTIFARRCTRLRQRTHETSKARHTIDQRKAPPGNRQNRDCAGH